MQKILIGLVIVILVIVAAWQVSGRDRIIFPNGGEELVLGKTYTLKWNGGPNPTQIFLVDSSLKSQGASVSITDRAVGINNTGSYEYTIPSGVTEGEYEFQIGDRTSKTFRIVAK